MPFNDRAFFGVQSASFYTIHPISHARHCCLPKVCQQFVVVGFSTLAEDYSTGGNIQGMIKATEANLAAAAWSASSSLSTLWCQTTTTFSLQ